MYLKATRLLLLFLLVLGAQVAVAQNKPAYQYMQLFYYGGKTMAGPVGHFSPALRGQTDIALASPTAYMKLLTDRMVGKPRNGEMQEGFAIASVDSNDIIDLTKMTPAQRKQYEEQERKREEQEQREQQANLDKSARLTADHIKALTERITQSLNAAAADGWEVTQMSSFGPDGVVYLLRKAR